jgi:hypothetical protein
LRRLLALIDFFRNESTADYHCHYRHNEDGRQHDAHIDLAAMGVWVHGAMHWVVTSRFYFNHQGANARTASMAAMDRPAAMRAVMLLLGGLGKPR